MASTLRQALEEIASESHPSPPVDDLWKQGKARHRLRTAGVALATTVLLGASCGLLLGLEAIRSVEPPAADVPGAELQLPNRVYDPSGWTKGARVVGPIAVAFSASRSSLTGSKHGIMTISAVDGGYRFIDAAGLDRLNGTAGEWALSPGGRYVAWWEPRANRGVWADAVESVRVYDAETGRVLVQEQPAVGGLIVVRDNLAWLDSDTLVFNVANVEEQGAGNDQTFTEMPLGAQVWDVAAGGIRQTDLIRWSVQRPRLLHERPRGSWEVDPESGARSSFARFPKQLVSLSISPSGARFAGLGPAVGRSRELVWGHVTEEGRPAVRSTGLIGAQVVAWRNDHEVVASLGGDTRQPYYELVDLDTGRVAPFVSVQYFDGDNLQIAWGLSSNPTTAGVVPPRVRDPRLPAAGGAAVFVLAAAWLIRRWRASRWS